MHRVKIGKRGFSNLTHCGDTYVGMKGVVLHPMDEDFGDVRICPKCKMKVRMIVITNGRSRIGIVDEELLPQEVQSVTEQFSHWKLATLVPLHAG